MDILKSIKYNEVLEDVESLKAYCKECGINIPHNSEFNKYLSSAKIVSDAWNMKDFGFPETKEFNSIMNDFIEVSRLSYATKHLLENNINIRNNLTKIVKAPLDVKNPSFSVGKNYAFELILAGHLAELKLGPELKEPDICFKLKDNLISIACKKIYSTKNLGKRLSEARKQIENNSNLGIIALCLDSLFNHREIFWLNNKNDMADKLINFLQHSADYYYRTLVKKSQSDKVIAIMLSISTASNLKEEFLFTMASQSMLIVMSDKYRNLVERLQVILAGGLA